MGGPLPLGYEVVDRKLIPLPEEAQTVRTIFAEYLSVGSVGRLVSRLVELQIVSKVRRYKSGRVTTLTQKAHEKLIGTSTNTKGAFVDLIQRIDVRSDAVAITLNERSSLGEALSPQTLITPAIKIRAGKQTKMVVQAAGASFTKIDRKLVTLLGEAIAVREMLADGMSLNDAASAIGSGPAYTARKARIGWLAPDIVMAIIEGRQPASLTRRVLSQANNLPLDWNKQRQVLGFDTVNAD